MMKSDRIYLCQWLGDSTDGYNDIPWPQVHRAVGTDMVTWLSAQDHTQCQMILERGQNLEHGFFKLYAEFYSPRLRTEFALRFAK